MTFKSKIDATFILLMTLLFGLFSWVLYLEIFAENASEGFGGSISLGLIFILILWFSLTCKYTIDGNVLRYKWGVMKGALPINSITSIEKNSILWSGVRPATSRNGLLIKYGKFEEIYFSPKEESKFIEELLKRNATIIVTQKK